MPSIGGRVLAVTVAGLVLVACQVSLTPPLDPAQVGLQRDDLPADLQRCSGSGSVNSYLKELAVHDPDGHATIQQGWHRLQVSPISQNRPRTIRSKPTTEWARPFSNNQS